MNPLTKQISHESRFLRLTSLYYPNKYFIDLDLIKQLAKTCFIMSKHTLYFKISTLINFIP